MVDTSYPWIIPQSTISERTLIKCVTSAYSTYFTRYMGINTRGLDDRRLKSKQGHEINLFSKTSRTALRPTQSPFKSVTGVLYHGVKQSER
jgi:hypothetical protein